MDAMRRQCICKSTRTRDEPENSSSLLALRVGPTEPCSALIKLDSDRVRALNRPKLGQASALKRPDLNLIQVLSWPNLGPFDPFTNMQIPYKKSSVLAGKSSIFAYLTHLHLMCHAYFSNYNMTISLNKYNARSLYFQTLIT